MKHIYLEYHDVSKELPPAHKDVQWISKNTRKFIGTGAYLPEEGGIYLYEFFGRYAPESFLYWVDLFDQEFPEQGKHPQPPPLEHPVILKGKK